MAAKTVTRSLQRLMPRFEPTALLQKSFFSSLHETKVKSWHFLNPKPRPCQIRANKNRAFWRCMTNIININWHDYAVKLISNRMISTGILGAREQFTSHLFVLLLFPVKEKKNFRLWTLSKEIGLFNNCLMWRRYDIVRTSELCERAVTRKNTLFES